MPKDSRQGSTLWSTVLADLRTRLDAGEFTERFPSDRELVAHYGVSRHTVREAVRRLDMIERRPRVGGLVRTPPTVLRRLLDTLTALGVQTSRTTTTGEHHSVEIAGRLDRAPRTLLTVHTAVLRADGGPLICLQICSAASDSVPSELADMLLDGSDRESGQVSVVYEGTVPAAPDPEVCEALGIPTGSVTFCIEARLDLADGAPILQRAYVRPDRYPCILQFSAP
ncbi:GntR family transcriptional regulator [Nocardia sp. CA2R105]|uniref:GntR family transcriptional regulator n=1 Tax=Nocardia coffeae TaxID=2873381 RepID=UPI001CA6F0BB|nr:GntR family transcriptional regulator [Nocardia coffeae]MBY8863798.1 GntR family transcriptional regulator [Nocardia coffeae]